MRLPVDWDKLNLTGDQLNQMAPTYALYRHRIDAAETELKWLDRRDLAVEAQMQLLHHRDNGLSRKPEPDGLDRLAKERDELVAKGLHLDAEQKRLRTTLVNELREVLTEDQRDRLLVLEARRLLPPDYHKLNLTDDQLRTLRPALGRLVPPSRRLIVELAENEAAQLANIRSTRNSIRAIGDLPGERDEFGNVSGKSELLERAFTLKQKSLQERRTQLRAALKKLADELAGEVQTVLTDQQKVLLAKLQGEAVRR